MKRGILALVLIISVPCIAMGGPRFHYSNISSAPFGFGYVEYVGEITNTSDRDYQTAVFNISFYDSQGQIIGNEKVILNDFNRGNTRSYSFQSKYKGDEIKIQAATLNPKYDPVRRRNIYIIAGVLLGLISAFIARSKGRSFIAFFVYGFFLPIVAIPHALIMKGR